MWCLSTSQTSVQTQLPKRWLLLVVICQAVEALLQLLADIVLWQHSRMHHTAALKLLLRTNLGIAGAGLSVPAPEASAMN